MKRELWMLGGLFIVSYGVLLWLTADEHQPAVNGTVVAVAPPLTAEGERTKLAEAPPTPQPDRMAQWAANEPLPEEGISSGDTESESAAPPPVMQPATSPTADALLQRVSSPDAAIQALSQALQPSSDRETRLAAVNALLVIGRKSMVDPAVIAMLKEAVNDADSAVAAEANSALAEVERETH